MLRMVKVRYPRSLGPSDPWPLRSHALWVERAGNHEGRMTVDAWAGFAASLAGSHPLLFSNVPVFVPAETMAEMKGVVTAVEAAARLPGYQDTVLAWAPAMRW